MSMMSTEPVNHHARTCIGCAHKSLPEAMVRLVVGPAGEVGVDAAGGAFGRGAHVHPSSECIEKACRGGLSRAFKRDIKLDAATLAASIREAYTRRALGILVGARRAGRLALGADAASEAFNKGAALVVIASDAGSVLSRFERAIASGNAVSFGTKAELGEIFGTGETAVLAVCHQGIAHALQHALQMRGSSAKSPITGSEER